MSKDIEYDFDKTPPQGRGVSKPEVTRIRDILDGMPVNASYVFPMNNISDRWQLQNVISSLGQDKQFTTRTEGEKRDQVRVWRLK